MASLFAVEARMLATLPALNLTELHTGLTPDQSGIASVRPDPTRAAQYLRSLRDRSAAWLRALSSASASGQALGPLVRALDSVTSEALAAIELLESFLFPRVHSPAIRCDEAILRAAAAVHRTVRIHGPLTPSVHHVRGLLRLLGAIIVDAEDHSIVQVSQTATRATIEVSVMREQFSEDRAGFLKFCAYLGRMHCERDATRTRLTIPLAVH
jgi:hypothetical protein